ncbi:MAG TPA: hypothetical protein VGF31_05840, partial [Myxococcaceae bacterium]
ATQEGVTVTASVAVPAGLDSFARPACARVARVGASLEVQVGTPSSRPRDADAVTVWVAGTIAAPDHLARALASRKVADVIAVAPACRALRLAVPGRPPYVVRKTRRFTSAEPSVDELVRDPAFLGRCVVPAARAPAWFPVTAEEHRRWGVEAWSSGPASRVPGPPAVDLPDLRAHRAARSMDDVRDVLADLSYQAPRWLERRAPLAFSRLRELFHRLRGGDR